MGKVRVLIEVAQPAPEPEAFGRFSAAAESPLAAERQAESLLAGLAGFGVDVDERSVPVPMLARGALPADLRESLAAFREPSANADLPSETVVVAAEVERGRLADLRAREGVVVWPDSELTLYADGPEGEDPIDLARCAGGTDCRPFRPAVRIAAVRRLLAVEGPWAAGFRGQNVIVGIIDEGVNGQAYPVVGGFARPDAGRRPGTAPVESHGSMCAADVLVAAPAARIYDYPFLGVPRSGGALEMFQAVLEQRRRDGTPHLTNNSYGFVGVPEREREPQHEVHDIDHPLHRKVREVVASGIACFFAAGNCGAECASAACHPSGIGPGRSIHGSNALAEVVTVAAVSARHERVGYSSQGPGMFEPAKPDLAAYTHFYGNFGPGRPAGGDADTFDNGTSAATPVAAGVAALLLSAFPDLPPDRLKAAMLGSATRVGASTGFDHLLGHGVVNAAAALRWLEREAALVG